MGEVIRKTASVLSILSDVLHVVLSARIHGGVWESEGLKILNPAADRASAADLAVKDAEEIFERATFSRDSAHRKVDACVGRIRDELYNLMDRPARHPEMALLFPGGIAAYTDCPAADKVAALEVLVDLLCSGLLTRVSLEQTAPMASDLRACTETLAKALQSHEKARIDLFKKTKLRQVLVQAAHHKLAALKRTYKSYGFTEVEIHRVIPEHPRPEKAPEVPEPPVPQGDGERLDTHPLGEPLVVPKVRLAGDAGRSGFEQGKHDTRSDKLDRSG